MVEKLLVEKTLDMQAAAPLEMEKSYRQRKVCSPWFQADAGFRLEKNLPIKYVPHFKHTIKISIFRHHKKLKVSLMSIKHIDELKSIVASIKNDVASFGQ